MRMRPAATLGILIALCAQNTLAAEIISFTNVDSKSSYWTSADEVELTEFRAIKPPQIVFDKGSSVSDCVLDGAVCNPLEPVPLPVDVSKPAPKTLTLSFKSGGEDRSISIKMFSKISPDFKVTGHSALSKNILISPWFYAMALSPRGEIVYYRDFGFNVQDFRPQIVNGKLFYSIMKVTKTTVMVNSEGVHLILDKNFREIESTGMEVDGHDFLYFGPRHYLVLNYFESKTAAGTCYIDQSAVEMKQGQPVYKFSVSDFYKRGYLPESVYKLAFKGRMCSGNAHLNSVQVLDRNRWLISFGNGSIFIWNKLTQKAEWIFSGPEDQFDLPPEQVTHLHHTPIWFPKENRLVVYDNNWLRKESRVLDFTLDPTKKTVIGYRETKLRNGWSSFGGSVQVDQDTVFSVGFGMRARGIWDFAEVTSGQKNMAIVFQKNVDGPYSYRVYRAPAELKKPALAKD